jgi:hypothetical protein
VAWTKRSENIAKRGGLQLGEVSYYGEALPPGHVPETIPEGDEEREEEEPSGGAGEEEQKGGERGEDSDDDEDDEEEAVDDGAEGDEQTTMLNSCDLLWQGIVPRRLFHGFRFQVPSSLSVASLRLSAGVPNSRHGSQGAGGEGHSPLLGHGHARRPPTRGCRRGLLTRQVTPSPHHLRHCSALIRVTRLRACH